MIKLTAIVILTLGLNVFGFSHNIRAAYFEISKAEQKYLLNVRFDRQDLLKELGAFSQLDEAVNKYLEDHFSLQFDEKSVEFVVNEVTMDDLYIKWSGGIAYPPQEFRRIKVWNTCLIDTIKGHSNLIVTKLYGRSRTFRLSSERLSTVIDYS